MKAQYFELKAMPLVLDNTKKARIKIKHWGAYSSISYPQTLGE
jgi:hypothetical protein